MQLFRGVITKIAFSIVRNISGLLHENIPEKENRLEAINIKLTFGIGKVRQPKESRHISIRVMKGYIKKCLLNICSDSISVTAET